MPELGTCRLCGETRELQDSHILPAFVYKWLKETSATGFMRFGQEPNKRVQDGYKARWLCLECEQRLNAWETQFATRVFHPMNEDGSAKVRYGNWLLKFSASVSWRTLLMMRENQWLHDFSDQQREAVDQGLETWGAFLLGKQPHPGRFEQHLIVLGAIDGEGSTLREVPANFNRYILRTVDLDVVRSSSTAFVLSKMGKFFVVGFIDVLYPRQWVGTKINATLGTVGGANCTLPRQFGEYLIEEAHRFAAVQRKVSDKQWARMDETMWRDLDRVARSGSMEAMRHDVRLAGRAAFGIHRPKERKD